MSSQDIMVIAGGVVFLLISLSIHEAAHALVATWCGDDTAKSLGRLTINPIKHLDLWYSIILPVIFLAASNGKFCFGGAKPVPVNPYRLRHPSRDMALVAIAGPLSNILLAIFFMLMFTVSLKFGYFTTEDLGATWLYGAGLTNVLLAIFNMIPIPPLDGSRVMGYLLPRKIADVYLSLEQFGIVIVMGLMVFGALQPVLGATVYPVFNGIKNFWLDSFGMWR